MTFILRKIVCIAMLLNFASALSNVGLLRNGIYEKQQLKQRNLASWTSPEYEALFHEHNRALWNMMDSSLSLSMSMGHSVPTNVPSASTTAPSMSREPTSSPSASPTISAAPSAAPTERPTFAPGTGGFVPLNKVSATKSAAKSGGMGRVGIAFTTVGCVAAVVAAAAVLVVYNKKKQGGGDLSGGNSSASSSAGGGFSTGADV